MQFLRRNNHLLRRHFHSVTTFSATPYATPSSRFPRDASLDQVVLHQRNLKPLIYLKNFIKSDPSKSLPLSLINSSKFSLYLPYRPIDFIRRYPLVFHEFFPGDVPGPPHVKLTKEILDLDAEEGLVYESVEYRMDLADRLLKLLMIGRVNKIKMRALEELKWELGLPDRFVEDFVPDFPDYFVVKKGGARGREYVLELVCWIEDLAVSAMEMVWLGKNVMESERGGEEEESGKWGTVRRGIKGKKEEKIEGNLQAFQFPVKYSNKFEMDKKHKAWLDEWQKLPCDSPYTVEKQAPVSKEFDKYAVAVLHEVLNLFVGMKGGKESVICIGDTLGLRSRFRRAMLQHPGIFYVSSKNRMYTVILKDGYKKGVLIKKNPLIEMRSKYIKLMHKRKEDDKETGPQREDRKPKNKGKREDQEDDGSNESNEEEEDEEDQEEEVSGLSNEEGDSEDDDEQGGYDEDNENIRGRFSDETRFSGKRNSRGVGRSSRREISSEARGERSSRSNRKIDYQGESLYPRSNRSENSSPRFNRKNDYKGENFSARSRGSPYVARQGRGAERENNMSGERQFNRQRRGAERENNMSRERQFNRQRRGADRENNMSGERPFNRQQRGVEREHNMSGEREFNQKRKQSV